MFPPVRAIVAAALLSSPSLARAQDSAAATRTARDTFTAVFLKRLGVAVDGYRYGRPLWVVISVRPPYPVQGVFLNPRDAEAARSHLTADSRADYRIEGPYVAPTDPGQTSIMLSVLCKRLDTQPCTRSDSTRYLEPAPLDSVLEVTITVRTTRGEQHVTYRRPIDVEAVFFTMSAVDKLLIPYYTYVFGAVYADSVRRSYLDRFTLSGQH